MAFESFGFRGSFLTAARVREAEALLAARERERQPLDLILTDMNLPDGTGLDLVRQVRSSTAWHMTPVIVLSGNDTKTGTGSNHKVPVPSTDSVTAAGTSLSSPTILGAVSPERTITGIRLQ